MPGLIRQSYSSSSSSDGSFNDDGSVSSSVVLQDLQYPALSFPGYSEKPISKQLEPIAVVGMGECFASNNVWVALLTRIKDADSLEMLAHLLNSGT